MSRKRPGSKHYQALDRRKWAKARRACFNRDGWRCRKCGAAGALEAHHILELDKGGDPYALANLETLCRGCHIEHHRAEKVSPERLAWAQFMKEMAG